MTGVDLLLRRYPQLKKHHPMRCRCGLVLAAKGTFLSPPHVGIEYDNCRCGEPGGVVSAYCDKEKEAEMAAQLRTLHDAMGEAPA